MTISISGSSQVLFPVRTPLINASKEGSYKTSHVVQAKFEALPDFALAFPSKVNNTVQGTQGLEYSSDKLPTVFSINFEENTKHKLNKFLRFLT